MYVGYFGVIPSEYIFSQVDIKQFYELFPVKFEEWILGEHEYLKQDREDWKSDKIYVLKENILIEKDAEEISISFQNKNNELVQKIIDFTRTLVRKKERKAHINLIIMKLNGLDNKKIEFEKPELELSKMYNDDFSSFHHKILAILREDNKSGLHLLYGKPGTGKSTYIRYLCGQVEKEIVFLPGQMAQNLDNIAMTKYLMDNPNSILVIEDAEELIVSRDQQRNSNLAMILNITDGILGESLGIQIIATFNTDLKNIDPALRRKGRLKSSYEFKALSPEKASILLQEQAFEYTPEKEMTLAEIFNNDEEEQYPGQERKAVGFR
ncbi:hypothetical protein GCM10007103_31030 [Salinimicrobium marinum]|uniref:ATPase AAA-type core domain-containing protein n=2 Tax=Salinimicrobium marinum TaxID=680283 RepID=A0A918W134_9FLAO|nr:hypothetical protein GCM10007103_31030 [Salinimicrobium marinum]